MLRSLLAAVLVAASLIFAGCSSNPTDDETVNWSAQRLYGEAKDAMIEAVEFAVARAY